VAHVVTPDCVRSTVAPAGPDGNFTLEQLQQVVGGLIEIVNLGPLVAVVNEDGIGLGLEFNPVASSLCGQPLVGTVLFCLSSQIK
jgi:hypothetical protein